LVPPRNRRSPALRGGASPCPQMFPRISSKKSLGHLIPSRVESVSAVFRKKRGWKISTPTEADAQHLKNHSAGYEKAGRLFTLRPPDLAAAYVFARRVSAARPATRIRKPPCGRAVHPDPLCLASPFWMRCRRTLPPRSNHPMRLQANFLLKDAAGFQRS
jgi:hypothetical protein